MKIEKIKTEKLIDIKSKIRPDNFDDFIGQDHIKSVLQTAIHSAKKRKGIMGHVLLSGPSGYGKTTVANIIAKQSAVSIKAITGYAINKPAEIISLLNNLQIGDILFIDEIHRLKPNIEEVLYIAMEDFIIDMVMPDGSDVKIPINEFTLVGATTKLENLSIPLKNRFIYNFHLMDYSIEQKKRIINQYLNKYNISFENHILHHIENNVSSTPRDIHNFIIKLRDYLTVHGNKDLTLTDTLWVDFLDHNKIKKGGISPIQQKYLDILDGYNRPIGLKTIATHLGINDKSIEEDIEPLLIKLGKVERTERGRMISE